MSKQKSAHVSPAKKKVVKELAELVKKSKTILIASIKNIPASQFQEIGKKLRGKATVKVLKKNLVFRAIDSSGNEAVKQLKDQIKDSVAILFSDLDSFELAAELIKIKSPAKAKPGQEAPEDIEVQAGPTELMPGPAISELGAVGIQVQIEKGKITIKESKVIVKKGQKISQAAAEIMSKLDIKPFSIGFVPLSAFDTQEGKVYININIDPEETLSKLKIAHSKALGFAVEINHPTEDTIKFLIGKAHSHGKALEKLSPKDEGSAPSQPPKEEVKEKTSEEKVEEKPVEEEKKEEVKEPEKDAEQAQDDKIGKNKIESDETQPKQENSNEQLTDKKDNEPQGEKKEDTQSDKPEGEEK